VPLPPPTLALRLQHNGSSAQDQLRCTGLSQGFAPQRICVNGLQLGFAPSVGNNAAGEVTVDDVTLVGKASSGTL